ncbi:MAG: hypothetical protein JW776_16395 [Candidatus Lokiarchaeota archaeon]|nr:hypothetical protein [Candidatus Lokiarchaeota archaeon]
MRRDPYLIKKSVYLFPAIEVSVDVNALKLLHIIIDLRTQPTVYFNGKEILRVKTQGLRYKSEWYGDCIEFMDPIENTSFFLGMYNNCLVCKGSFDCILNQKNLQRLKITNYEFPNGNILILPVKKYEPSYDIKELITVFDKIEDFFQPSYKWKHNAPILKLEGFNYLWADSWVLHRINTFYPERHLSTKWICACRNSSELSNKISVWDTVHIIEDLKFYDLKRAEEQLRILTDLYKSKPEEVFPPIISYSIIELSKLVGDKNICSNSMQWMDENLMWWEKYRYFSDVGLFGYKDMRVEDIAQETEQINSPRWHYQYNGEKWRKLPSKKTRNLVSVDLNALMADYYQNLGVIALSKEDESLARDYFDTAERLINAMHEVLWDDTEKFYFDYDLETNCIQPIYTSSSFWSLFGGCVFKQDLNSYIKHLTNPAKFWGLSIPSIAFDSPFYSQNFWAGPSWISLNYFIIVGLKRYNLGSLASQIGLKVLKYLENSYYNYNKLFEFYNPLTISQQPLKRIYRHTSPYPNYLGHVPIHAIFYYGLMKGTLLEDDFHMIPDWTQIKSQLEFELYYNNNKIMFKPERLKTKILELSREQ